jgi:hypothetical protein
VRADEKLTAFLELEAAIRACGELFDRLAKFLPNSASLNGFESGGGRFPRYVLRLFRTRVPKLNSAGKR